MQSFQGLQHPSQSREPPFLAPIALATRSLDAQNPASIRPGGPMACGLVIVDLSRHLPLAGLPWGAHLPLMSDHFLSPQQPQRGVW